MQAKGRKRFLLICCEGKTEKEYFRILMHLYRLPGTQVLILGEKGQHKTLIDRTVDERDSYCQEHGTDRDEVECWAVCDDDNMRISYTELQQYAEEKDVRLAFSRPQFEAYLLQHFEQSAVHDQKQLYSELSRYASEHLHDTVSYEKANLDWLKDLIDIRPKLVDIAITNADQHAKQSGRVFLTVQQLVKRMRELAL